MVHACPKILPPDYRPPPIIALGPVVRIFYRPGELVKRYECAITAEVGTDFYHCERPIISASID